MVIVSFEPNYTLVMISLLIYGIGVFPRMTIGYVYALELTPEHGVRTLGMLMFTGECFTIIVSNLYLVCGGRNALYFVWACVVFSVLPLFFSFLLPESPKYLHSIKETQKAKESMQEIARINMQRNTKFDDVHIQKVSSISTKSGVVKGKYCGLMDLWLDKPTLINTVAMAYLWGFYTFGHHCLIFMLKYVPGNKYINGLAIALAVTAAPLLTRVIQNYCSTKQIYFMFSTLAVVSSFLHIVAFDSDSIAALVMIVFIAI